MIHIYRFTEMVDIACEALIACHTVDSASTHLPIHAAVDCLVAVAEGAVELLLELCSCLDEKQAGGIQLSSHDAVKAATPAAGV